MSELESYLSTIGPDLQNMTRLFGLPDSVWEHPVFSYTVREEHGQFFCVFQDETRQVEGHAPVPEMTGDARLDLLHRKRVLRRLCRQTLYDLLRVRTGMHPPWGSMTGILTEGNTGNLDESVIFRPTDPCLRGEMISFLYQTHLAEEAANAPELYEFGPVNVAIPQTYSELVYRNITAVGDDEDGIFIIISERASREAAEALGEDPDETGAGELFSIGRVSKEEAQKIVDEDIGNAEVFAKDENDKYYVFYHPTDVRYVRETPEQMTADQDQWIALNEWARNDVRNDIFKYSEGLTPVTLTSTSSAE